MVATRSGATYRSLRSPPSYRSASKQDSKQQEVYTLKVSGLPKLTDREKKMMSKTLPNYVSMEDYLRSKTWIENTIVKECKGKAECAGIFDLDWSIQVPESPKKTFPVSLVMPLDVTPRPTNSEIALTRTIFKKWLKRHFTVVV